MKDPYRTVLENRCEVCYDKDARIHELEAHKTDLTALRVAYFARFSKQIASIMTLTLAAAVTLVGSAWCYYNIPGLLYMVAGILVVVGTGASSFLALLGTYLDYGSDKEHLAETMKKMRAERQEKAKAEAT